MERENTIWRRIHTAFPDACTSETFCEDPPLRSSLFPEQREKAHLMQESSWMPEISVKTPGKGNARNTEPALWSTGMRV